MGFDLPGTELHSIERTGAGERVTSCRYCLAAGWGLVCAFGLGLGAFAMYSGVTPLLTQAVP